MRQASAEEFWRGSFGDDYHERNAEANIETRVDLWNEILWCPKGPGEKVTSCLEIGAGSGVNLQALRRLGYGPLTAIEPNVAARAVLNEHFYAFDGTAANPGEVADLVFTSGVLIHIPPDELLKACRGIYDAAQRYIVSLEYFATDPEEKSYRGHNLWKRDFGAFWLDNFDLKPLGCGFAWHRTTGLDDLTWWIFRKCA